MEIDDLQSLVPVAQALADESRLRLLAVLLEGEATVSDLVVQLGLAQPRVSTHLAVLRRANLVTSRITGRQRTYRVDAARIGAALTALRSLAGSNNSLPRRSPQATREVRHDSPIRRARTCYDHLAGVAAVDLLDGLLHRRWLAASIDQQSLYTVTDDGARALTARGVDIEQAITARRRFAFGCLDWTERRSHLGGALGAELLRALERDAVIERTPTSRVVQLRNPIACWLDGRCPA